MTEPHRPRVKYVIGPDGSPLTIADLPAPGTKRWVIRRKAEVVAAVRGGLLSLEEACSRYTLTSRNSCPGSIRSTSTASPACAPRASSNTGSKVFVIDPVSAGRVWPGVSPRRALATLKAAAFPTDYQRVASRLRGFVVS